MRAMTIMLTAAALVGCDGPAEQAGEKADNAAGIVSSEDTIQSGPQETLGERRDDANEAAADARETRADALEDAADAERAAAKQRAEVLDQRAEQARKQ